MDNYQPNRDCHCTRCRAKGIMGPVILITLGVLFLLDNLGVHGFDFDRTWPVILLAIGAVKLLQSSAPTVGHVEVVPPLTVMPPGGAPPPPSEVRNG